MLISALASACNRNVEKCATCKIKTTLLKPNREITVLSLRRDKDMYDSLIIKSHNKTSEHLDSFALLLEKDSSTAFINKSFFDLIYEIDTIFSIDKEGKRMKFTSNDYEHDDFIKSLTMNENENCVSLCAKKHEMVLFLHQFRQGKFIDSYRGRNIYNW